ncbi:uncharacterized protein NDAI_0A05040 [Naumovozyma dairenensis CBS 421]|uniref:Uncharacterized protein n=1 Tax=Naumovozyma dairenensis (strain ATCC 10597 / BCRC 20456 / CBS 421 / NBRC 0211 / NRRL Y-12639) TaxID=1071378 RepID=G0W4C1_NAUDC|nr:hypothetical protein NDAI_0A05040 [Naumovozyma dairenensis CBS 421]CCD22659.1 hypothetical protein NDAI_0A05040 [Naumovozyma dairenensis CBS 421]
MGSDNSTSPKRETIPYEKTGEVALVTDKEFCDATVMKMKGPIKSLPFVTVLSGGCDRELDSINDTMEKLEQKVESISQQSSQELSRLESTLRGMESEKKGKKQFYQLARDKMKNKGTKESTFVRLQKKLTWWNRKKESSSTSEDLNYFPLDRTMTRDLLINQTIYSSEGSSADAKILGCKHTVDPETLDVFSRTITDQNNFPESPTLISNFLSKSCPDLPLDHDTYRRSQFSGESILSDDGLPFFPRDRDLCDDHNINCQLLLEADTENNSKLSCGNERNEFTELRSGSDTFDDTPQSTFDKWKQKIKRNIDKFNEALETWYNRRNNDSTTMTTIRSISP